ncbi:Calx-beta domain-containing protein [Candidatus Marithrix sp. Canyon 246]|uniref:Calx-beta domain-containing protein n=1 Tax=Candidatus Marithrix sp. Canyon 246 TaxID=1827136 RepID=UPI00084A0088|nr:hypothetical protein [Candidatus Marithrix sp. Canyon 246]
MRKRQILIFLIAIIHYQAFATNHIVSINEIMAGLNGDSNVQFVEMSVPLGQHLWGPQGSESVGRTMLVFFNANDQQTGRFVFPSNPNVTQSEHIILIATQAFADLPGAPTPDFIMPREIIPITGKVCFQGNSDNPGHFGVNLCLSYGGLTSLPILGARSLSRFQNFHNHGSHNNADFQLDNPTPATTQVGNDHDFLENHDGEITLTESSIKEQGHNVFMRETFEGNGRTCNTCHIKPHLGLNPEQIDALPATDPLFIAEFNLNTLQLSAKSQPSDLRGIITDSNSNTAKILSGTNDTYLIYGGSNLNGTVTDSNGNTGSISQFTAGGLNQLENPTLMKGQNPSGIKRALILENVNGTDKPEFMRNSPHLLNVGETGPFGWSPPFGGANTLQDFAAGAVKQHFPRTLQRQFGSDFREPLQAELDAMDVFMKQVAVSSQRDLDKLATTAAQKRGRDFFEGVAKCSVCHSGDVLAHASGEFNTQEGVNEDFNTGVAKQAINTTDGLPTEQAPDTPANSRKFNISSLLGTCMTRPWFHDGSAATLRDAVKFYDSSEFITSPAAGKIGGAPGLNDNMINDITAFLQALVDLPVDFPLSLSFTEQTVNQSSPQQTVQITNISADGVRIINAQMVGSHSNSFNLVTSVSTTLFNTGQQKSLNIVFEPKQAGALTAILELTIESDNANAPCAPYKIGISLTGEGKVPPGDGIFNISGTPSDLENIGIAGVEIVRNGSNSGAVSVDIEITGGTASCPDDYELTMGGCLTGTLNWADGDNSPRRPFVIKNDTQNEPNETITFKLLNPGNGAVLGTDIAKTFTIIDKPVGTGTGNTADELIPTYQIGQNKVNIGRVTIKETVAGLLQLNKTITFTLPNGTNWETAPSISGTNGISFSEAQNFTLGDTTVTFLITATSNDSPSEITFSGRNVMNIGNNFTAGAIKVAIAGNSGVTHGEVQIAIAGDNTTTATTTPVVINSNTATSNPSQTASAIYIISNKNPEKAGDITFNKFMMELYQPLTDKPTGEYAIFSAPAGSNFTLEVLPGFNDVRIPQTTINALTNMAQVQIISIIPNRVASTEGFKYPVCSAAKIGQNNNSLPAFSRIQETLCIPNIKIANVVNLPDGNNIQLRQECQEITMDMSTTQNDILKIKQIRKIPTNNCQ